MHELKRDVLEMISQRRARLVLAVCAGLAATWLTGCPPTPKPPKEVAIDATFGPAPVVGQDPEAAGIYMSVPRGTLTGDALTRAGMDRKAVAAEVRKATAASTQAATQSVTSQPTVVRDPNAEPPALAIKYYLQGREKFLEGANSEAMDFLDKALGLDPEAFTVLRLMGRVCFASNQLARGNYYLQRASVLRPEDVEVNYLLGRYYLETREWPRAIQYLLRADESPERAPTTAQGPLVTFYLARALQSGGYYRAAANEFDTFLKIMSEPLAAYRYDRELNFLLDEEWAVELAAAENFAAAGDYRKALPHYEAAAAASSKEPFITARLVSALAHTGKGPEATELAMKLLADVGATDEVMALLVWTYRAGGRESQMLPDLRKQLTTVPDRSAATRALAGVLDRVGKTAEATSVLEQQVRENPADTATLESLLTRLDKDGDYSRALADAGQALQKAPAEKQEDIIRLFRPLLDARKGDVDKAILSNPYCLYLDTLALEQSGQGAAVSPQKAREVLLARLAEVVQGAPRFFPAEQGYIELLLAAEQFKLADDLIQQALAAKQGGARTVQLQVESEVAQHRYSNALKIAKEGKVAFPRSTELRMAIVAIYRLRGQDKESDAELLATIDEFPKFEPAYRLLIDSYLERGREEGQSNRYLGEAVALLGRLLREVKDSRYAQTATATLYAFNGQLPQAEELFKKLLAQDPADPDVVVPAAQVRYRLGQQDEAAALLETAIKKRPTTAVADLLAKLELDRGHNAKALEVSEKLMKEHPEVENWLLLQASGLIAQDRRSDAVLLISEGVTKFPRSQQMVITYARLLAADGKAEEAVKIYQTFITQNGENTDRLYILAGLQSTAGQEEAAEATLKRVLAIIPNHTGANNDLGYFWVDAGKNLSEATEMIRKALVNQPTNAAFLDSLGWAYYKQGKYKESVDFLSKAVMQPGGMESELLSHLGDALYRAGKREEAAERWTQAQALMAGMQKPNVKLKTHLDKVMQQLRDGKSPELAPLGQGVKIEQEI